MRFLLPLLALACAGDKSTDTTGGTGDTAPPTTDTEPPTGTTSTGDERLATIIALTGDPAAGQGTYEFICAACHGADGTGNAAFGYPSLVDNVPGLTHDQIVTTIFYGAGNMDAYDSTLKNQEMADVAAYVETTFGPPAQ